MTTKNEHAGRRYAAVFCFGDEIYDDMPLLNYYQCQFHYISQILVNNRQKRLPTYSICLSLHVLSVFSLLLLLLLSVKLLSAEFAAVSKLST